jgi:hypothetical protein
MKQFGFLLTGPLSLFVLCHGSAVVSEEQRFASYAEHQNLSYYLQRDGSRAAIRTIDDWQKRRQHILAGMQEAMGPLPRPAEPVPLDVEVLEEHVADNFVRRKLAYHTDRRDYKVKAWLLLPLPPGEGPGDGALPENFQRRPAVLCLHQTTPNGKDSPVGLSDRPSMHYALELARRGYVTLSPDYPSFGEHDHDFDADSYASGSMKAVYDNIRAIDLLQSLPEVDPERIGCIGHSLGGHNALFTAVFDQRIQAVVTSCGFTSFHKYKGGDLHGWSGARYMPRVATRYNFLPDEMPFDFHEVLATIAPRAVFVIAPLRDDNFDVSGVRDCVEAAHPVYALLGQPDRLQVIYPDAIHDFPDTARQTAYKVFDRLLK